MKGLVLGINTHSLKEETVISSCSAAFKDVDSKCNGKLTSALKSTGPIIKSSTKILWGPMFKHDDQNNLDIDCIAVVDLGSVDANENSYEDIDLVSENIRCAIANGISALKSASKFESIYLDDCGRPRCVGESAALTSFSYKEESKQESSKKPRIHYHLYKYENISGDINSEYEKGLLLGESQNFSRFLQESPANLMTPTIFVNAVEKKVKNDNVKVIIRDKDWIQSMKMGSFLSVAQGSSEEPKFLELHYDGDSDTDKCIALVGKGITFDSGGYSLKPQSTMSIMRVDMGGAACVVSAFYAVSVLKLKINLKVFTPLTENMVNGKATKPGDVVTAMNGKTIEVDNTDAEGRLVLADALCYAQQFKPAAILDFATLTGAIKIALGVACSGVFTQDDDLFKQLHKAGYITGDRVWRMPLYRHYTQQVTKSLLADVVNSVPGGGGSATAAAFLKEFVDSNTRWVHADISCVKEKADYHSPYFCKGFTGRPVRTLIQFLETAAENFSTF